MPNNEQSITSLYETSTEVVPIPERAEKVVNRLKTLSMCTNPLAEYRSTAGVLLDPEEGDESPKPTGMARLEAAQDGLEGRRAMMMDMVGTVSDVYNVWKNGVQMSEDTTYFPLQDVPDLTAYLNEGIQYLRFNEKEQDLLPVLGNKPYGDEAKEYVSRMDALGILVNGPLIDNRTTQEKLEQAPTMEEPVSKYLKTLSRGCEQIAMGVMAEFRTYLDSEEYKDEAHKDVWRGLADDAGKLLAVASVFDTWLEQLPEITEAKVAQLKEELQDEQDSKNVLRDSFAPGDDKGASLKSRLMN